MASHDILQVFWRDDCPIQALEAAVDNAARHSFNLARVIEGALPEGDIGNEPESQVLGGHMLRQWIREANDLNEERKNVEVMVGVQGQTGAGKSSLLNVLLGYRNILPPSNMEAATATVCKVAYNYNDDPQQKFRAEVVFHTRHEITKELETFIQRIKERNKDLNNEDIDDDADKEEERERRIELANEDIREGARKIKAVWGYTQVQLEALVDTLSPAFFLNQEHPALATISGGKKCIRSAHERSFAKEIKPYLDSTTVKIPRATSTADQTPDEVEMAMWPLVKQVNLYLKSDNLKGGIVLVDLPGLSDVVESREAVAREFYSQLAVSIVVTHSVRGADEQTGVNLMKRAQELDMLMNNQSYCVALSKMDDICWETTARDLERHDQIDQIKKLKAKSDYGTLSDPMLRYLVGNEVFTAVKARNIRLIQRLTQDAKERHDGLTLVNSKDQGQSTAVFRPPEVFPVSARAYWEWCDRNPMEGFPNDLYTGIPALVHWLHEATTPQRRMHAKVLLSKYVSLFHRISTWSENECNIQKVPFSKEEVKTMLDNNFKAILGKFEKYSGTLRTAFRKINPLQNQDQAIEWCVNRLDYIIQGWQYKDPMIRTKTNKLNHQTYMANVRRNGDQFISRAGGRKTTYNWMEDLSSDFKTQIAAQWSHDFHQEIPNVLITAQTHVDQLWAKVTRSLRDQLDYKFPSQQDFIESQGQTLLALKEEVKGMLAMIVHDISKKSIRIHGGLKDRMQRQWKPGFKEARELKAKRTVMFLRQKALKDWAKEHGRRVYSGSIADLDKDIKAVFADLPDMLQRCWERAIEILKLQINTIVEKIFLAEYPDTEDYQRAENDKVKLQQKVRSIVDTWWQDWHTEPEYTTPQDTAIPEIYEDDNLANKIKTEEEEDWSDEDDRDDESDEEIDEKPRRKTGKKRVKREPSDDYEAIPIWNPTNARSRKASPPPAPSKRKGKRKEAPTKPKRRYNKKKKMAAEEKYDYY